MKHIKKFYLFLEAENLEGSDDINSIPNDTQMDNSTDVAEKSALAEVEKNLKDFQNRQQKMVNIFNDKKIITDSDLEKALLSGVYDNKKENRARNRYLKDLTLMIFIS